MSSPNERSATQVFNVTRQVVGPVLVACVCTGLYATVFRNLWLCACVGASSAGVFVVLYQSVSRRITLTQVSWCVLGVGDMVAVMCLLLISAGMTAPYIAFLLLLPWKLLRILAALLVIRGAWFGRSRDDYIAAAFVLVSTAAALYGAFTEGYI